MKLCMCIFKEKKALFKKRGFTLIELLVVIAIIGILASVVLASLSTARDKGTNASLRSSMSAMRPQAEIYYTSAGETYELADGVDSVCVNDDSTDPKGALTLYNTVSTLNGGLVDCNDLPGEWAAAAQLVGGDSGDYFCVDSTGFAGVKTGTVGVEFDADATVCP